MGRKLLIILSVIFVILYGLYYYGVPAVINSHTDLIVEKIYAKTGYKISVKNPVFKTGKIPSIKVSASYFALLNNDNSMAFEVEKPFINVSLLPLLFNRVNIRNFSAQNIVINTVYDTDFRLKIGDYPLVKADVKLNSAKADISSYTINLDDKIRQEKISIYGKYLKVDDFVNNKRAKISTEAKLTDKNSKIKASLDIKLPLRKISNKKVTVDGYLKNIDLADFSAYASLLTDNKISNLSGILNSYTETQNNGHIVSSLNIKNLEISDKVPSLSIKSNGLLKINSDINTVDNGLNINELKILGNKVNVLVSGTVTDLSEKIPVLNIKTLINNSKAENFVSLLPPLKDLSPDINFEALKKTGFWGNVNAELNIKGKADLPEVFGKMDINNAYMVKPIPNAEKANIKMNFKGDKFDLDVTVPTSPLETVYVNGYVNLDRERSADLKIMSTANVDLKTAQIILNPLHEVLRFDLGPVPIMDIKGKGGIDLHVTGTRKNPYGWGQFRFKNASATFNDINNMILTNSFGTLDFEEQNTFFRVGTALLNGKPVYIKGTCTLLGVLDYDIIAGGQDVSEFVKSIQTSPMLKDLQNLINPIESASGNADLNLKLTGYVKDINSLVFNKNIFAQGNIKFLSDKIKIQNLPQFTISGILNFKNLDMDFSFISNVNSSKIAANGKINDNNCNIKLVADKFNAADAVKAVIPKSPYAKELTTINTSFNAYYSGKLDDINYNKIFLKGKIFPNRGAKSSIIVNDGAFELSNSNLKVSQLYGTFKGSPYNVSLKVSNFFSKNKVLNGNFKISSFDLNLLKIISGLFPAETAKILKDIEFLNSVVNLNVNVVNNKLNGFSNLDNISFIYKPDHIKFTINKGNVSIKNNTLNIGKISAKIGDMPVFINGMVYNVLNNPNVDLYINSKLSQEFFDQFFNKASVYPVKLKGDVFFTSKLKGALGNVNAFTTLNINEDSSLYYMGASVGDSENSVKISVNNVFYPDKIKINNFQYDKIIKSQNNKPITNTMLNASGTMATGKILKFNNFKIVTKAPTDAKIFNIIFRKPFMKQGIFTSDLVLNGTSINPVINGKLNITSIDIPFFDSTFNDLNLLFKNGRIYIKSKGTVLTNEIYFNAVLKNKLTPPYVVEELKLKLADLDMNKITDAIRDIEADITQNPSYTSVSSNQQFDLTEFIIKTANVEADKIKVRNINANNFSSELSINDKKLVNVEKFKFDIAEGSVLGNLEYNLLNNKTNLDIHLNNANAAIMSEALFDLKGQVYGSVNGDFNLTCTGKSNENCFKTLSGKGNFKIADGRIPKLGSLEYLLKAGNFLKGGITGLSINGIFDLITPLKTGSFESISGDIHLKNGIADKINIYSGGHDLNMYMTGSYNIVTSVADMIIYGSLSKNITTVFGKIKNASLNTLFNSIPGIGTNNDQMLLHAEVAKIPNIKNATDIFRVFKVNINGDINGENYVKDFRWVK